MKKLIICLIGAIILSNCEIRPKQTHAQGNSAVIEGYDSKRITTYDYSFSGMHYKAFITYAPSSYETSVSVVNITRDSLQCEIIKANLKKLKNGNN